MTLSERDDYEAAPFNSMNRDNYRVRAGTWLYDGTVRCGVEIWRRSLRPGTGDYEDPPDVQDDQEGEWYEILYEPAGGGFYDSLKAALEAVHEATHGTIRWDDA
jgi:hypothetical protein